MRAREVSQGISFTLSRDEALVLFELLQRLVEENEAKLLPLLKSSAEFAVLCRLNNHLEMHLPEALLESYDSLLAKARTALIRENGRYEGIAES